MLSTLVYIGPGLGIGTIVLVFVILLIVAASFAMILWISVKKFLKRLFFIKSNK